MCLEIRKNHGFGRQTPPNRPWCSAFPTHVQVYLHSNLPRVTPQKHLLTNLHVKDAGRHIFFRQECPVL